MRTLIATHRPFTPTHDGLEVEDLTWEDYLALAGIEPLDPVDREAEQVTLTDRLNNGGR